jgi:hypothetical protein
MSRSAALLMTALLMSGCATPFLHDPAIEAQTKTVKEAWSKVDDAEYFKSLRAAYATLQAEEDAALTRSLQATRDRNLASYLAPSTVPNLALSDPTRGVNKLCNDTDRRLSRLVGGAHPYSLPEELGPYVCPVVPADAQLVAWSRLPNMIGGYRRAIRPARETHTKAVEQFVAKRADWRKAQEGAGSEPPAGPNLSLSCEKIPAAWATSTTLADAIGAAALPGYPVDQFQAVVHACHGSDGTSGLAGALGTLGPGGKLDNTIGARDGSIIRAILQRNAAARSESARSEAAAAVLAAELKALEKRIKDARTGATSKAFWAELADVKETLAEAPEAAKLVGAEKLASFLEEALKAELAAAADAGKPAKDAEGEEPSTTSAGAPASSPGGESGATTADAASGTGAAASAEADEGSAEEEPSVTTKRVEAIIQLGGAGAGLADAIRVNDPDRRASALLILLAAQRQRLDMLRLSAAREKDRLAVLDAELLGAATELALLAEARLFLTRVPATSEGVVTLANAGQRAAALSAFNRAALAWSEGRIPMNMARLRHVYLNRNYRITMAEKTSENWRGLIRPAVDQISAAGPQGIRAETIANLLGQLGIAGTILGE